MKLRTLIIMLFSVLVLLVVFFAAYIVLVKMKPTELIDLSDVQSNYNSGNIDAAIYDADALLQVNHNDTQALLSLAAAYAQKGSLTFNEKTYAEKSLEVAQRIVLLDPSNSEAYRVMGYAYEIMQKYDDARLNYEKAISLNSQNAEAYSNEGHTYDLQGNAEKALTFYAKALTVDPHNEHALLNEARVLAALDRPDEARIAADTLVKTSLNARFLSDGYQMLAMLAVSGENADYDSGKKYVEKAILYDPNSPQAWVSLGFMKMNTLYDTETDEEFQGEIKDINRAVERALAINPHQASAYYLASLTAGIVGNKEKEADMKKKALEAIPFDITLGATEKESLKAEIQSGFIQVDLNS